MFGLLAVTALALTACSDSDPQPSPAPIAGAGAPSDNVTLAAAGGTTGVLNQPSAGGTRAGVGGSSQAGAADVLSAAGAAAGASIGGSSFSTETTAGAGAGGAPVVDTSVAGMGAMGGAPPVSRTPVRMLLVDEGNAAVHLVDLEQPDNEWTYRVDTQDTCCNLLRDIQLIGDNHVMLSRPAGFLELDLANRGALVRQVDLQPRPGDIEAARRLPNGHTVVAGNGGGGIFVSEFDESDELVEGHAVVFPGLDTLRGMRLTPTETFLFSSDTPDAKQVVEGNWAGEATPLFTLPVDLPAGHMTKAVWTGPGEITLSTGYGASLIRIDTAQQQITQLTGGTDEPRPAEAARDLALHFFAGYQVLANGDVVVTNWINHGTDHNGEGYQVLQFDRDGTLIWYFDQTQRPGISSVHNVVVLDGLDLTKLHDDRDGVLRPQE